MPTLDLGPVVGPQGKQGEIGPEGKQGIQGPAGPSATINGLPAVTITGGEKIQLEQDGTDLTINCTASNQNLVINSDFRNPVNRNGLDVYPRGVNLDRWICDGGTTISDGYITAENNFYQIIPEQEASQYLGKQVTLSVLYHDGTLESGTVTFPIDFPNETKGINVPNTANLAIALYANRRIQIFRLNGGPHEIVAVKTELGPVQTLAHKEGDTWVLNAPPDYALQYALCSQYSPLTGEFVGSQQSNENLLANWYFVDPINQRGEAEYTFTKASYFIDRWSFHNRGGSYNVTTSTLTMNENSYSGIYQRLESPKKFEGKTLTASFLYSADIDTFFQLVVIKNNQRTLVAEAKVTAHENPECVSITGVVPNGITALDVQLFNKTGSVGIAGTAVLEAAKLELGPVQTLAHKEGDTWVLNDPPPNKALELAKCQRYQSVLTANGNNITIATGRCLSDSNITAALPIGPLRIIPANIANPTGLIAATDIFSGTTFPITAVTFIGYRPGEKMITALFKCPTGTVGTIYRVGLLSGNSLVFNANL